MPESGYQTFDACFLRASEVFFLFRGALLRFILFEVNFQTLESFPIYYIH